MRLLALRVLAVVFSISTLGVLVVHASCTHQDSIAPEPQVAPLNPPAPLLSAPATPAGAAAKPAPVVEDDDSDQRFLPATKAAPVFVPRKSKSKAASQQQAGQP